VPLLIAPPSAAGTVPVERPPVSVMPVRLTASTPNPVTVTSRLALLPETVSSPDPGPVIVTASVTDRAVPLSVIVCGTAKFVPALGVVLNTIVSAVP
jgi:hypothetical protein